jgi:diaminopimelate decarboxylase
VQEIAIISKMAKDCGYTPRVLMRITPGVDAHTHDFIKTGCTDSKFGFTLEDGTALKAAGEVMRLENIKFAGVHCHIGSQIFDIKPFTDTADIMLRYIAFLRDKYGYATVQRGVVLTDDRLNGLDIRDKKE